ncbi:RBBP9/YdeN family alpha/beta hydrolase [Catenulispora yoronensis]
MRYVIIPGYGGSGPDHWQDKWQRAWGDGAIRIRPESWDKPDLDDWCAALDRAADTVRQAGEDLVLVAHSLGCLATAAWLGEPRPGVRGAFLVAPPSVASARFPRTEAASFVPVVHTRLTTPTLVVSSDDDPYCDPETARQLTVIWNAGLVSVGRAGHINAASGLGMWPFGQALLAAFVAGTGLGTDARVLDS